MTRKPVTEMADDNGPGSRPRTGPRAVISLSQGARLCMVVSALFLVLAAYYYWVPVGRTVPNNFPANCGSAANPPHDSLGKAICGTLNDGRRVQALAALGAAVVMAAGGLLSFGVRREIFPAAPPHSEP